MFDLRVTRIWKQSLNYQANRNTLANDVRCLHQSNVVIKSKTVKGKEKKEKNYNLNNAKPWKFSFKMLNTTKVPKDWKKKKKKRSPRFFWMTFDGLVCLAWAGQ